MVVTGVLFLFMPFCAIPICCRSTKDDMDDIENPDKQKEKDKNKNKEGEEEFDDPRKIQGNGNQGQRNNMD